MIFKYLMIIYLLILSYDDIRLKKVPVFMLKIGLASVCIWLFSDAFLPMPPSEPVRRVVTALLGAFPGGALTGLSLISDKVGKGDGIVMIIVGMTESCSFAMILICISCVGLALVSGILMCFRKVSGKTRMPYIPFVTGAYMFLKLYEGGLFTI